MATGANRPEVVRDWKSMIPPGSRWHPGDPVDPACPKCQGIGYVRLEGLPVNHKYFGKLIFCECTIGRVKPPPEPDDDARN